MGINLWSYKLQAFFIGCVYAGVAGSLLVHYYGFASVDQFPFMDSVWYIGMLIVGGMGSIPGAILGAVSLKLLDELVTLVGPILSTAVAAQAAAALALITRGLVIILFLIFEPRGLEHRWELIKAYVRLWPFSHQESNGLGKGGSIEEYELCISVPLVDKPLNSIVAPNYQVRWSKLIAEDRFHDLISAYRLTADNARVGVIQLIYSSY